MCSPISRDFGRHFWQTIFKLDIFQPTLVRFTLSLAEAAPEGAQVLDRPVSMTDHMSTIGMDLSVEHRFCCENWICGNFDLF